MRLWLSWGAGGHQAGWEGGGGRAAQEAGLYPVGGGSQRVYEKRRAEMVSRECCSGGQDLGELRNGNGQAR